MKKIACLFLIVLLIALMAVPAFSAIEQPERRILILDAYSSAIGLLDSGEAVRNTYFMVLAPATYNGIYWFLFSERPIVEASDSLVAIYFQTSTGSLNRVPTRPKPSDFSVRDGDFRLVVGNRAVTFSYYVSDFSTTSFGSSIDLSGADWDWEINILGDYIDSASLEILLQDSSSIKNIGYTPSSWSAFQGAIQSAIDLLEQPEYTQEQIDSAYDALLDAKNSLVLLPDVSELERLLAACKALPSVSYTPSSYAALNAAILEAESVLALIEYTEQQISEAYFALESARDSLVILPDTAELESLLAACKAISVDSYTAKSFAALQSAIKQAEKLLTQLDYTDSDIADAISSLQSAKDNLVEISASDAALRQNLLLFIEILLSSIAEIVPIAILVFGIVACALLVPRVLKWFF